MPYETSNVDDGSDTLTSQVMQRDTAEFEAKEEYTSSKHFTRSNLGNEEEEMSERVYSKYGSKHATTIVASIIESVEDNLLHGMRVGCACGV